VQYCKVSNTVYIQPYFSQQAYKIGFLIGKLIFINVTFGQKYKYI